MKNFCAVIAGSGIDMPCDAKRHADLEGWIGRSLLEQGVDTVTRYDAGCGVSLSKLALDFAGESGKKYVFIATEHIPYIDAPDLRKILTSCRYSPLPALAVDVTQRHIAGIALSAEELSLLPPDTTIEALAAALPAHQSFTVQCHVVKSAVELYHFSLFAKTRLIESHLSAGVLILSADGLLLSPRARIGKNTLILPGTALLGDTVVGSDCVIGPNCVIDDTVIGDRVTFKASFAQKSVVGSDCTVGPFANLRPGSRLADRVKVGDFVEIKNSSIGEKTSVAHLTYVGDSDVGCHVNFGCGTVTVNYDGRAKHRTVIGDHVFVGCNANLIAPVTVHDNAYIAAGSTITQDVPEGALAIARERQTVKTDWVSKRAAQAGDNL